MNAFGGNGTGNLTATAGNAIRYLIQPHSQGFTRVTKNVYTAQGTAHTLTFLRPIGRTTASAGASSGQANVSFTGQAGPSGNLLAANDLVAIREIDGVTRFYVVSSVPGGYPGTVVLTSNLVAGVAAGEKIWNFGIVGDTNPADGATHPSLRGIASQTTPTRTARRGSSRRSRLMTRSCSVATTRRPQAPWNSTGHTRSPEKCVCMVL